MTTTPDLSAPAAGRILVTGCRGAVSRALLDRLAQSETPAVAATSTPTADQLTDGVRLCDLREPASFPAALKDIDTVFLYCEPSTINEFIDVAVDQGVRHIVVLSSSSVLEPDAEDDPLAQVHLDVEQALRATDRLVTTVLRPGAFDSNARQWAWQIRSTGQVRLPYPDAQTAPIHEADIAAVAAEAVAGRAGVGGTHLLTGPQRLTLAEQVDVISRHIGRPVPVQWIGDDEALAELTPHVGPDIADSLLVMWCHASEEEAVVSDDVLTLTGRVPRPFDQWVQEHVQEFMA